MQHAMQLACAVGTTGLRHSRPSSPPGIVTAGHRHCQASSLPGIIIVGQSNQGPHTDWRLGATAGVVE